MCIAEKVSRSKVLVDKSDLCEFQSTEACSVIVKAADLVTICNTGISYYTSISVYIDSHEKPVLIKLNAVNGIGVECILAPLPGTNDAFNDFTIELPTFYTRNDHYIPDSFEEYDPDDVVIDGSCPEDTHDECVDIYDDHNLARTRIHVAAPLGE